ncbi:PAS domain-containing protein [Hymenobacter tibetensis]|uniref:protein-glutamate O-methyltransferase n=1 Tax=Hymenobacter tibetensis TaxID=497967 RepID=A0ABY4CSR2_9BACT|nr:CheR family methyltransferase [Hymenobacter tibetensis]UOG73082.1 PAS domain-containing protein [Hymenobacter tibetensis]
MNKNSEGPDSPPSTTSHAGANATELAAEAGIEIQPGPDRVGFSTARNPINFSVVCLGGSAGSLSALEDILRAIPESSGVAYVVVTHQMPGADGELRQVLQHFTSVPVIEVTDGLRVRPNHIYVIPPAKDMSLLHGTLHLFEPTQQPGRRLPIDYFLQSLAKDVRDRAVCVILSGMGSDGSIGLKMVMENFGMVMVQEPESAEYDGMPRAAIATEFVDYILPAAEIVPRLLNYVHQPATRRLLRAQAAAPDAPPSLPAHALQKIFILIRNQTGHDFSYYKRNTVFRRIERRMNSHQIKEFTQYVRYLQENPGEVEQLFKELLIGVTKFFRDPEAYAVLRRSLLPLVRKKEPGSTIRVWAPGCSTGEEAYSLAMTLRECLDTEPDRNLSFQLFATDINPESIDQARAGFYPANIAADISAERLRRFFTKVDNSYQIRKDVRDSMVFALHNISKDAPFTRLDLLCCRNLLIYLSSELQKSLIPVFHYALNPGGLLFLGPSENLTGFQELFTPLDVKWKISRANETPSQLVRLANFPFSTSRQQQPVATIPSSMVSSSVPRRDNMFAALIQRLLLASYAPPAVVINQKGEILFVNGRTGKYLEPAPGLSGLNIFDMAREELHFEISEAVHRAVQERHVIVNEDVKVKTEAGVQQLRLTVKYLEGPEQLAGLLLVVFEDVAPPRRVRRGKGGLDPGRDAQITTLEKELQYTRHRLQTTIEEMESSLEELKSTNEELQSANEELQSTNEEAMTNKEEMQSLNEELMTLNMQYLHKTEELSQAANDMKNLLDATEIATIFIDNDMIIKRFTPPVGRIIPLLPTDVGRPLTHFANNLRYEQLATDVTQVIDRLVSVETTIQTTTGDWYAMRILPYRTLDNYINGAVITFTDISSLKQLEDEMEVSRRFAESVVETVREPLMVLDGELHVLTVSPSFADAFGVTPAAVKGQPLTVLCNGAWNQPDLLGHLRMLLNANSITFDDVEFEAAFPNVGTLRIQLYGRRITSEGRRTNHLLLGAQIIESVQA